MASAGGNLGGSTYTYADTISYTPAGLLAKERFGTTASLGTALYHNLHYNNRLQLVDIRLGDSSTDEWTWTRGALIFYYGATARDTWNAFANSTDNNGNVLRQVNYVPLAGGGYAIPQLDDYTYDSLNRITSMTEAQQNSGGTWTFGVTSQTFTIDRWGNRLNVAGATAQNWDATAAAATNRLKLQSGTSCTGVKNGLCYDAAGNLIFDNQLGSAGDRTYDAENRIVTAAGGGANSYVYNADGKRVRRMVGAQTFFHVYGIGGELVGEYLWNGSTAALQKEYGYRDGEMLIVAEGATVRWLVTDHLGTPRILADQAGSLAGITRHDYFPFGEENLLGAQRIGNGYQPEGVRQKYTGKERDNETGLDFLGARYLSNVQGRFTSVDSLRASGKRYIPQSWNRYSYALNNPLMYTDPTGLLWVRNNSSGAYTWIPDDLWGEASQQTYDNGKQLYTPLKPEELEYDTDQGRVRLDPRGPNSGNPTGWAIVGSNLGSGAGAMAVGAIVTSQADSPVPGPADILAIGLLGFALYQWATYETQQLPISNPYLESRKADLKLIDHIADKYGVDRHELGKLIHEVKESMGRDHKGRRPELTKEEIEELARELQGTPSDSTPPKEEKKPNQ